MSRGSSSSTSISTICHCGAPLELIKSGTQDNPCRRFLACKFYDRVTKTRGCKYFRWVDEPQTEWQRNVINDLRICQKLSYECYISFKAEMEQEMKKLKEENARLVILCSKPKTIMSFSKSFYVLFILFVVILSIVVGILA